MHIPQISGSQSGSHGTLGCPKKALLVKPISELEVYWHLKYNEGCRQIFLLKRKGSANQIRLKTTALDRWKITRTNSKEKLNWSFCRAKTGSRNNFALFEKAIFYHLKKLCDFDGIFFRFQWKLWSLSHEIWCTGYLEFSWIFHSRIINIFPQQIQIKVTSFIVIFLS